MIRMTLYECYAGWLRWEILGSDGDEGHFSPALSCFGSLQFILGCSACSRRNIIPTSLSASHPPSQSFSILFFTFE